MSDHAPAAAAAQPYFPAAEWETLQAEDQHGGRAVVGLMVGIFTIGLVLYIGVMLFVMADPNAL